MNFAGCVIVLQLFKLLLSVNDFPPNISVRSQNNPSDSRDITVITGTGSVVKFGYLFLNLIFLIPAFSSDAFGQQTGSWIRCATQYAICSFSGVRDVRYGAGGVYVTKAAIAGSVACNNSVFGDPVPGSQKYCDYWSKTVATVTTTTTLPAQPPPPTQVPPSVGSNIAVPAAISIPSNALAIPSGVANGATVSLLCGRVYRGTLDLAGKSNVTVNVSGTCGKPTIIPSSTGDYGINAAQSSGVTISGVKIQDAYNGIHAMQAKKITIENTDILRSKQSGVWCSGTDGIIFRNSSISDSGFKGFDSDGFVANASISNVTIVNTANGGRMYIGGVGLYIYSGSNNNVDHVTVNNSFYHGIVNLSSQNSFVKNSLVTKSCTGDHDCGGIYTGSKDLKVLTLLIDGNKVDGSGGIGIYLDDSANGVTVSNNEVMNTEYGITLHNAFNTVITKNKLSKSSVAYFALADDLTQMKNNKFTYNNVVTSAVSQQQKPENCWIL